MDQKTWQSLIDVHRQAQVSMMAEGLVSPPTLFAFCRGAMVGYVTLRPVHIGEDAGTGISEMSYLAAAAFADEVVAVWETMDVAFACELPPAFEGSCLNVMWASPSGQLLQRLPYTEAVQPGVTANGLRRVALDWQAEPAPEREPVLEPAIEAMLHFCWKPFDMDVPNLLEQAALYLEAQGYSVNLAA